MKRCLLATASSLALIGSAMAIQPAMAQGASLTPVWTGSYVGLNGGAVRQRMNAHASVMGTQLYDAKLSGTGATLGGQIGYNWQTDNFVAGLEADLNWADARKSGAQEAIGVLNWAGNFSTRMSWFATLRARAGVTLAPPTLLYVTGGLALAGIKNRSWDNEPVPGFVGPTTSGTRTGWTVGAGIEHFLTPNLTIKAEALYLDFGRKTATNDSLNTGDYVTRFRNTAVVGRLGVNVKW